MNRKETLTNHGAREIARTIIEYWMKRGYTPAVTVVASDNYDSNHRGVICVVRSDMINGQPRPRARVGGVA
jgi:hypothetical protein